jgi:hypothetical protein
MTTTDLRRPVVPFTRLHWETVQAELAQARANLAQARLVLHRAERLRDYARAKLVSGPPDLRP